MNRTESSLTQLLNRWQQGDARAFDLLQPQVMRELEKMAESRMHGEHAATIAPMDLLQEALLRVLEGADRGAERDAPNGPATQAPSPTAADPKTTWANRAHFFATMSLHMRAILVDRARARRADKRGGGALHVTLSHVEHQGQTGLAGPDYSAEESLAVELISLDETLTKLAAVDARGAEILHLTYFAGLDREEIATVLSISVRTVDRELRFARAWLSSQLGREIE
jgi:RNA polymerase sigma factor (TIGR02999 family)